MDIKEYLALPHRFMWGGDGRPHRADPNGFFYNDCTTFCATWVEMQIGVDPAKDLRGTYRTEDGAHAILGAAGGIIPFMAGKLEPLGFKRVQNPVDGDIGVIHAIAGLGFSTDIAALRFGPLWACLGRNGVAAKKAEFLAAWSLPS